MIDESLGTYTFLPWLRRGAATSISNVDPLSSSPPSRVTLPVELTVNARNVSVQARLYGPGDVIGLDARQVARTEPQVDSVDFPPNYFAAVDLAREDLPWLFTPLKADAQGRLRPWIVLVVVRRQDGVQLRMRTSGPLPVLEIDVPAVPSNELPDLAESWAWAHVQVSGTPDTGQTIEDYLDSNPHLGCSRLVCPQRLRPNARYYACIVPAFRAGVQSGLGVDEDVADLAPAWVHGTTPSRVQLPVYYHWTFSTGSRGDFESLARALRPRAVGPEVGQRPMDVGNPGAGLPQIADDAPGRILAIEGALRSPKTVTHPWPDAARVPFEQSARVLLNAPADAAPDPVVGPILAPPLHGRWHALKERVPDDEPHWFRELNLDPRYRASAGLGALVVQRDQEELMEEAWAQVGDIVRANQELRRAQLARAVASSFQLKHLDVLPADQLVHLTRPVHARITLSAHTLHAEVERSAIPDAAFSGALRRFARPRGPLARRMQRQGLMRWRSIPGRMNVGDITPAQARRIPDGTADLDSLAAAVGPEIPSLFRKREAVWLLVLVAMLLFVVAVRAASAGAWPLVLILALIAAAAAVAAVVLRGAQRRADQADRVLSDRLTPEAVHEVPPRLDFRIITPPQDPPPSQAPPSPPGAVDSSEAQRFRAAAATALERAQDVIRPRPHVVARPLDLSGIAKRLTARLDPERTVVARVRSRIRILPELWRAEDPIEPVMAYPEFPRPMYESLAEISEDFIIPGLEHIPPNTVTLLETNPPVVQSFMAGLNHEMARELLWREYPTDQRGSCFRQFWDPRGRVPPPGTESERKALYDVPELHRWRPSEHLGASLTSGEGRQLVLLLRGELLRRFPTAMIFAERAHRHQHSGRLEPEGSIRWPLFRGLLRPDMYFLGFDLTEEEARGSSDDIGDPGWYFVIQQQPTEPRFGLDVAKHFADTLPSLETWDNLSWGHLALESQFDALTFVRVTDTLPDTTHIPEPPGVAWGGNAAQMAFITLQKPTRVAIHARVMLPRSDDGDDDD